MNNYIRACFCIERKIPISQLKIIIDLLGNQYCSDFSLPILDFENWVEINFLYGNNAKKHYGRLLQVVNPYNTNVMVSFDIDDSLFHIDQSINYFPGGDREYEEYKNILILLIKQLDPIIGIIDWEADLLCPANQNNMIECWGNYLSNRFLKFWKLNEKASINNYVDEMIPISDLGILVFNHPLGLSEKNDGHINFWNLINKYISSVI